MQKVLEQLDQTDWNKIAGTRWYYRWALKELKYETEELRGVHLLSLKSGRIMTGRIINMMPIFKKAPEEILAITGQ